MSNVWQDVAYALRGLRKSPAFTVVALLTLGVGIGANTAMFSVLNAVLLQPLPYHAPEQLTMLWTEAGQRRGEGRSSYADVQRWRAQNGSFTDIAVFDPVSMTLTDSEDLKRITGVRTSPNFFAVLGVQPYRGRVFTNDDAEQRRRVIVISQRFWRTQLAAAPDAVGKSIAIDGLRSEVIGILPDDTQFLGAGVDVWEPHTLFPDFKVRLSELGGRSWFAIGRLRPDVSVERAQGEMTALSRSLSPGPPPASQARGIGLTPLSLHLVGATTRLGLWMLSGAVFFVFLIGVTNIISLSVARSTGRSKEFALRTALGAGRSRLFRQLLTESVTLAALSGLLGVAVAAASVPTIRALVPTALLPPSGLSVDGTVLGWALGITLLAGVGIGIAPSMMMNAGNLRRALQDGGRGASPGRSTRRVYRGLVVAEFALAIVLLVSAGLLTRSLLLVEGVDPGFNPSGVLSVQLSSPPSWSGTQRVDYYERVLEQVRGVEGVEAAGMIGDFFIGSAGEQTVTIDGAAPTAEPVRMRRDEVSSDLFAALQIPVIRGRSFSSEDGPNSPRVAIVNETFARQMWPGQDPVGRRFKLGPASSGAPWFTIVGLAGDVRRQGLEHRPVAQMFEPLSQNPGRNETLLIRTNADDPTIMAATIASAIRRVENGVPVYGLTPLRDRLALFQADRRFQTTVLAAFSLAALFLAAVGIYGTIHHSIATRTHEIGVRMAVGAQRRDIFTLIVGEGLGLSAAGVALGLVGALWLGRLGSSLLFGITAADPVTYFAVSLLLTAVAVAACYLPARRATRVDPLVALRYE